ncbi:hypothetical protein F9802_15735 [Bacillus aerolatus]|uniref:Spore coat protein CotO n=1 Tax=Bacillus aerolatus TaxID=2653354 RepID=A0A6I1FHC3_9BACI|nr:CotO family spore coat protein [Bacillus aerolatus]KAB7705010.1 hypothetical protein F9802_15735 [Bacillus aerolatus]
MEKNKEKREPLMYIHQPEFVWPEPVMQRVYHTKNESQKAEKNSKNQIYEETKKEKLAEETNQHVKEPEQVQKKKEPPKEEKKEVRERPAWMDIQPVKRFQDMKMDEKLQHLMTQFTTLPCLFDCGEQSHKGILREVSPTQIQVRTFKGDIVTIERQDLKRIKLLGPL